MSLRKHGAAESSFVKRLCITGLVGAWCAAGAIAAEQGRVSQPAAGSSGVAAAPAHPVEPGLPAPADNPCVSVPNRPATTIAEGGVLGGHDHNSNGTRNGGELLHCITPEPWRGPRVEWNRDVNPPNKIEDAIDQAAADERFDIVVNYKRGIGAADIGFLSNLGGRARVSYLCKYITSAAMRDVSAQQIGRIADRPEVAFIELQHGFGPSLAVSVPTICVTQASGGCAMTVQSGYPMLNGSGVNIAIIDSGIDDGHCAFDPNRYVDGYDATTRTFVNPDDDLGHGTHVAAIALGESASGGNSRGVAPGAGFIDVRVFDINSFCNSPGLWETIVNGVETVYDNRDVWAVRVMNMSFRQCNAAGSVPSNGLDSFSQLIDLAEAMGIVSVASASNDGPDNTFLPTPGAATRAITVAASYDMGTVSRADDQIASFSSKGPRDSDGDDDYFDELKPEVAAPGHFIAAAAHDAPCGATFNSGTSMAAPHVAGLAALIIQGRPDINAASVKALIIDGADPRGGCSNCPLDPEWNDRWGWGLINGYKSIAALGMADVTFPNYPSVPIWLSEDIRSDAPPQLGVNNRLYAKIQNRGPNPATNIRVHFGTHVLSSSVPAFHDIGTFVIPSLADGQTLEVSVPWRPFASGHQCLYAEIAYGSDVNYCNNIAQRNIEVAQSPVAFQVRQLFPGGSKRIEFRTNIDAQRTGWAVAFSHPDLELGPDDCPVMVEALPLPPRGTRNGERALIHIEAVTDGRSLGGVSISAMMRDCDGNGWDDYEDIRDGRASDRNRNGVPDSCDPVACTLDLDGSGRVSLDDAFILLSSWDQMGIGDVNGNGVTDHKDLESLLRSLGEACQNPITEAIR